MPRPYKHPKTGVYWYRQRVPASLGSLPKGKTVTVTIDGKPTTPKIGSDIKVSLGTKEPKVAKQRAKHAQGQFDLIWASFDDAPERHRARGSVVAMPGTSERRPATRALAGAELEALYRIVERDDGAGPASQQHPEQFAMLPVEA